MSGIIAELLTIANKVDNYEIYTGVSDIFWESTTSFKAIVPAGKRWFVIGGTINRDVSGFVDTSCYNSAGKKILLLDYQAAATGATSYPNSAKYFSAAMVPMDAGEWVRMIFGAAQSTAAYASVMVLEIEI